jgi:hypothetical protein
MTTQIVIHLLPHEIDWFEWQIKQLKQGSYYLEKNDNIIIDVTLNLNLINWKKSSLPKQFFIDKFNQIRDLCDWCETQFIVDDENQCLGCNDKRRQSIRSSSSDNIIYLDCDLIFRPETLAYLLSSVKIIQSEYYIISPQTIRLWDTSWDILTHSDYCNIPPSLENYHNTDPFRVINSIQEDIKLKPINNFKFGGGWFNLLSTKLLKTVDIPDSLGPYGVDDTYVIFCCNILKQKGYDIQRYVMDGSVLTENNKYRWDPYKKYLYLINKWDEFRVQAEKNLNIEIKNFINKI